MLERAPRACMHMHTCIELTPCMLADLEQAMAKACADAGLAHLANQPPTPLRRFV